MATSVFPFPPGCPAKDRKRMKVRQVQNESGRRRKKQLVTSPPQFITLCSIWSQENLSHHLHLPQPNSTPRPLWLTHLFSLYDCIHQEKMTNLMFWDEINCNCVCGFLFCFVFCFFFTQLEFFSLITASACVKSLQNRMLYWQLDSEPEGWYISLSGFQKGEGVGIGPRLCQTEKSQLFLLSLEDWLDTGV